MREGCIGTEVQQNEYYRGMVMPLHNAKECAGGEIIQVGVWVFRDLCYPLIDRTSGAAALRSTPKRAKGCHRQTAQGNFLAKNVRTVWHLVSLRLHRAQDILGCGGLLE